MSEESPQEGSQPSNRTRNIAIYLVLIVVSAAVGATLGIIMTRDSQQAEPSPSPAPQLDFLYRDLGETVRTSLGNRVTVYSVEKGRLPKDSSAVNITLWQVDVEWCAGPTQEPVSVDGVVGRFFLRTVDGYRAPASLYARAKQPVLSSSLGMVSPGECIRGLIHFNVPSDKTPEYIAFAGATLVRWRSGLEGAPVTPTPTP